MLWLFSFYHFTEEAKTCKKDIEDGNDDLVAVLLLSLSPTVTSPQSPHSSIPLHESDIEVLHSHDRTHRRRPHRNCIITT